MGNTPEELEEIDYVWKHGGKIGAKLRDDLNSSRYRYWYTKPTSEIVEPYIDEDRSYLVPKGFYYWIISGPITDLGV